MRGMQRASWRQSCDMPKDVEDVEVSLGSAAFAKLISGSSSGRPHLAHGLSRLMSRLRGRELPAARNQKRALRPDLERGHGKLKSLKRKAHSERDFALRDPNVVPCSTLNAIGSYIYI